jgi:RimJ/RimL family protein N-acetyltransferase
MLTLETKRLTLRDFLQEDFEAFYQTSLDPEYQQFYSEKETTRDFWVEIFDQILVGATRDERLAYQVAICLKSGELIGTCGVRIEDTEHRQASFGIAVEKSYWGKGLAFEASQRIIDYGFKSQPIHRLYAETNSENRRAIALLECLGMRFEGEFRQNQFFRDRWWNTTIYAILKPEWEEAT